MLNKPTHVTRNTVTNTDHIITNTVRSCIQHRFGTTKTDISDYFRIVFALSKCDKITQKIRHNLFINASTEKTKQSYSSMD